LENVDITYDHLDFLQIFYDHLVHFVFIWYIFSGFGIMYPEKSGNPDNKTGEQFFGKKLFRCARHKSVCRRTLTRELRTRASKRHSSSSFLLLRHSGKRVHN
jgi:hypothetical protein